MVSAELDFSLFFSNFFFCYIYDGKIPDKKCEKSNYCTVSCKLKL